MREENVHKDHRSRLRQRFINEGLDSFEDHNVLELLLFYSIPQKDTNETAHYLLERFGSISEVFNAPISELVKVQGVGECSAVLLSLIPQLSQKYMLSQADNSRICGVEEIAKFASSLFEDMTNEKFILICVDNKLTMLNYHIIAEGTVDNSIMNVRKIEGILLGSNATAAVIAHNHLHGNSKPSRKDLKTTIQIAESLKLIGIGLLDHVVVGADDYTSMAANPKAYKCYLRPV